jgi:hypothetical protein
MNRVDRTIIEDVDIYRHWHAQSEHFAGGDCLATLLLTGWTIKNAVFMDTYWLAGTRQVHVFHFEVSRGDASVSIPVLGNPYVDRLIQQYDLMVVAVERPGILSAKASATEVDREAVKVPARSARV